MTTRHATRRYGIAALAFCLAGAAVYARMTGVTLAHLEAVSGEAPFDMRPLGYGPQEAARLLGALGEQGRRYYLTRQIPLDTVYPALLAMTLVSTLLLFAPRLPGRRLVRVGIALSVGAALFDYTENLGIAAMLLRWPDLPDAVVRATSTATIVKSAFTTAAVATVLLVGIRWWRRSGAEHHP